MSGRHAIAGTFIVLLACGCSEQPPSASRPGTTAPPIHFTDVTASSGIDMIWTSGRTPITQIVEAKGGGVALIDYDDDGDLDVFAPNGATMDAPDAGPGCRLFENLGNLTFRDVTAEAGLTFRGWGIGVAVGDYDNDGHDDLYITCFGRNALLRNTGAGTFEDVTDAAGVSGKDASGDSGASGGWSAASAFGDLDGDGDLDLYVANYLDFDLARPPSPSTFKGAPIFRGPLGLPPRADVLFENLGDGTFRDITASSGCAEVAPAYGLGVVILDFDHDGRQDIYVGNDSTPNFLFMSRGGLRFEDEGGRRGLAANIDGAEQSTMGIGIADVSGDGFADVFTTNFSNDTNTLHISKQGRFFDDETRKYGVGMLSFPYVGWAAGFYDLDHDGDEDLLLFNGHVYRNAAMEVMDAEYLEPPLLYAREGDRFVHVDDPSTSGDWLTEPYCDRGAAFGDLDDDGDIDVIIVEINGPLRVLRNDCNRDGWLIVELEPTSLGSRIELTTANGTKQIRWVYSGGSFVSASAQSAHFGLPPGTATVDLTITWPDGSKQELPDVAVNQRVVVERPG